MKKLFFSSLLLLTFFATANAQDESGSPLFLRVYGNYALPLSGSFKPSNIISNGNKIFTSSEDVSIKPSETTFKKNNNALGKGLRAGIGLGYIVSDFINIGLDIDYYMSGNLPANYTATVYAQKTRDTTWDYSGTTSYNASFLSLVPNITYKAIAHPSYFFYGRLGLMIGVMQKFKETFQMDSSIAIHSARRKDITSVVQEHEYKGGLSFGFNTALGIQLKIISTLRLNIEIQNNYYVYTPKSKELTASKVSYNGESSDGLAGLSESAKVTNFEKEYTETTSTTETQQAKQAPKLKIPYNSLGLGIGLAYKF